MSKMIVKTPEILWHGGGLQCGKPDPVLSVDMYGNNILATSGIDANVPPKGSVRLWKVGKEDEDVQFLVDLSDHQSVINAVRFSPCGRMIACASDRQIVVYYVSDPRMWETVTDPKMVERIWLRPCLQEIYDLEWSPDSVYVIAGSIDSKGEILRAKGRDALALRGHSSYVQGVAWDPMNKMVVTQSADRSCRVHQLKHRGTSMVKLAPRGHSVIRMTGGASGFGNGEDGGEGEVALQSTPAPVSPLIGSGAVPETPQLSPAAKSTNLFADSTVPCFFRRPAFSPDGSLLVVPTGILRGTSPNDTTHTFATHIFHRGDMQSPVVSLAGLEDPSVAVRFSPVLYTPKHNASRVGEESESLFQGPYRMVFAVMTTTSVLIYDTQHAHPLAYIGGCHLASINDAAWSADGRMLVFCSSDGYVSFARFSDDCLGTPLPLSAVPEEVQRAFPSVYLPPMVDTPQTAAPEEPTAVKAAPSAPSTSAAASSLLLAATASSSASVTVASSEDKEETTKRSVQDMSSEEPQHPKEGVDSDSKKKRRITPLVVSPSESLAPVLPAAAASSSDGLNTSPMKLRDDLSVVGIAQECQTVSAEGDAKKAKKRITPVHVGDAVSLPQLP